MKKKFSLFLLALVAVAILAPKNAMADEIFASQLSSPGVYWGNGNVNSGFDVLNTTNSDGSTLQLGLSIINRYLGPIDPTANDYYVNQGSGQYATWDFAFSVNTGDDPLSAYTYRISVVNDTTGGTMSFDPTQLPDNAQANANGVVCNGCAMNMSNNGFQNAENLGFSFISTPLGGFNPAALDTYTVTLSALPTNGINLDPSVSVNAITETPEPATIALMGTGLLLLGFAVKKSRLVDGAATNTTAAL